MEEGQVRVYPNNRSLADTPGFSWSACRAEKDVNKDLNLLCVYTALNDNIDD